MLTERFSFTGLHLLNTGHSENAQKYTKYQTKCGPTDLNVRPICEPNWRTFVAVSDYVDAQQLVLT